MPSAKLRVTVPEHIWIGDLSRTFPEAVVRVLAAFTDDGTGVGLAEVECESIGRFLEQLGSADDIHALEIIRRTGHSALLQFETTVPLLLLPPRESGVPLEMPIEIQDGAVEWELTASHDRLSALGDELEDEGITFEVESVRDQGGTDDDLLTDRQLRLLSTAVEGGYYDTPREQSLTELADDLGIAKSSASETLHRAEEKVVKEYLDTASLEEPPPADAQV
jgi:hypothetical protein